MDATGVGSKHFVTLCECLQSVTALRWKMDFIIFWKYDIIAAQHGFSFFALGIGTFERKMDQNKITE